jgi:hypothetical protein
MMSSNHPTASAAGRAAAGLLLVAAGFQVTLAAGAPFGEASFGGANPGVLPDGLRAGSAVAAVAYAALAGVAGTRLTGATLRRRLLSGTAALMTCGSVLNLASPSLVERMIWTPVTVALAITLWHAARDASLSKASGPGVESAAVHT